MVGVHLVDKMTPERRHMELEIECKFLMTGFPTELPLLRRVEIQQGYVSIDPEVRIHKATNMDTGITNYRITMKGEGDLTRVEIKNSLEKEFYEEAVKLVKYPMIQKEYRAYEIGEYILEVCLVDPGTENEFYYGEVEFPSEKEANEFEPIPCLGKEVTLNANYKMKNYWLRTRADR